MISTESAAFAPEAERVAAVLRDQIIDGARAPGSRLVERDIAAEMAVSRIPVRDALRLLVAEGLVTPATPYLGGRAHLHHRRHRGS